MVKLNCLSVFCHKTKTAKVEDDIQNLELPVQMQGRYAWPQPDAVEEKNMVQPSVKGPFSLDVDALNRSILTDGSYGHPAAELHDTIVNDNDTHALEEKNMVQSSGAALPLNDSLKIYTLPLYPRADTVKSNTSADASHGHLGAQLHDAATDEHNSYALEEKNMVQSSGETLPLNDSLKSYTLPLSPEADIVKSNTSGDASYGHPGAEFHDAALDEKIIHAFLVPSITKENHEAEVFTTGKDSQFCCGYKAYGKLDSDSVDNSEEESGSEVSETDSNRDFTRSIMLVNGNGDAFHFFTSENDDTAVRDEQQYRESPNGYNYAFEAGTPVAVDHVLAGHLSDPGIFRRENSQCASPASPVCTIPIAPDFETISAPNFEAIGVSSMQQNCESQSCGAVSCDKMSHDVKHSSEPSCLLNESITFAEQAFCNGRPGYHSDREASQRTSADAGHKRVEASPLLHEGSESGVVQGGTIDSDLTQESAHSRVMKWINNIQLLDFPMEASYGLDLTLGISDANKGEFETVVGAHQQAANPVSVDQWLASSAMRSLNISSAVAHLSGLGLREVPLMGTFSFLKTLNLSMNHIARIPPGSLPRNLHSLDLSRNKLSTVEGFRELTRLRVLNHSHNRISRIGHGLANCTLIKELYLAGNKIAEVEGLHRLLKLSVLDVSYNKLATSKALGQLAANYNSLLALNLLGNPILMNCGEEQLRKMIFSLAPHVTYLNKQPIKVVSVREAAVDSVAKAALGTAKRSSRTRRTSAMPSGSLHKKLPGSRKDLQKRLVLPSSRHASTNSLKLPKPHKHHHHHHHQQQQAGDSHHSSRTGKHSMVYHEKFFQHFAIDAGVMHRSRSDGALQE